VLRSLSVVILIAGLLPAADRQVTYQGDIAPLSISPTFDHGFLIVWDRDTDGVTKALKTISVYGPTGSRLYQSAIQGPNLKEATLLNGAADDDGTVAVVFDLPGGFAILDSSGKQIQTVVTSPYVPTQICFAPDHTIWVAGNTAYGKDEMLFRRYSRDGKELGRFVPGSTFSSKRTVARCIGGRDYSPGPMGLWCFLKRLSLHRTFP